MPLVPITEDQDNAMADQTFVSLLLACGLRKPSNEQVNLSFSNAYISFLYQLFVNSY